MIAKKKIVLSWSGGKDGALAMHYLLCSGEYELVSLLTTFASTYGRVSHHGVREELMDLQAAALRVPLHKEFVPDPCTNEMYEDVMRRAMLAYIRSGVETVAFGDIFLEDLRQYREGKLAEVGMKALFPLWQRDTKEIVREFVDLGFRATVVCVDGKKLSRDFVGRSIDDQFVRDLPDTVDPCGENGEFHSFVHDGPIFDVPVYVVPGEIVSRDTRHFADLRSSVTAGIAPDEHGRDDVLRRVPRQGEMRC